MNHVKDAQRGTATASPAAPGMPNPSTVERVHEIAEGFASFGMLSPTLALDLAHKAFELRVGKKPNAAQAEALRRQVREGYIDGKPANIDHTAGQQLQTGMLIVEEGSRAKRLFVNSRERAQAAAERMDGLTIAQAAEATGMSARAIRARVDRGTLRAWKGPDGRRRIPRADLVHTGLIDPESDTAQKPQASTEGSGSGSAANAAQQPTGDQGGIVLALWEKAEQAVREAAEHRLLAAQADTRLREAEATAKRFEEALHEARSEAAVASAEADKLREALAAVHAAAPINPHQEDTSERRRRWWQRGR